ncbi:hypothetical protein HOI26_06125 [Candidatus Woesearchaeota archaeon]|nr:hypothetical protein [Candidatus Woesearchaeota archaeon]
MGKLPRKIKLEELIGFVICRFGPLPCADKDDKHRLLALARLYDRAVKKGGIVHNLGELPQFKKEGTRGDYDVLQIVGYHGLKNSSLLPVSATKILTNAVFSSLSYRLFGPRYVGIKTVRKMCPKI